MTNIIMIIVTEQTPKLNPTWVFTLVINLKAFLDSIFSFPATKINQTTLKINMLKLHPTWVQLVNKTQ
ncbi:hypothetical protein APS56_06960 [Pseudalgibacter alginicilyticus]|uniref:Uncharacterized protein n=1 Tax=Pseudalgibacter alginicilyticus TaxID=1736674 RepID=A0A0P0CFF9_9FLAO|nr:hypothetical protein [Pseudalgibacter alginicilyticus]ALJ04875.1 hypothetical protein APS56_06960 [Pseudalgibacter alginicilyticus]